MVGAEEVKQDAVGGDEDQDDEQGDGADGGGEAGAEARRARDQGMFVKPALDFLGHFQGTGVALGGIGGHPRVSTGYGIRCIHQSAAPAVRIASMSARPTNHSVRSVGTLSNPTTFLIWS